MIYDSGPSRGDKWGTAVGQSIGSVLNGLAQGKAQQLHHRSLTHALQIQGVKNPSAAAALLLLDNKAGQGMLQHGYGEESRNLERQKEDRRVEEARGIGEYLNNLANNSSNSAKPTLPPATPNTQPPQKNTAVPGATVPPNQNQNNAPTPTLPAATAAPNKQGLPGVPETFKNNGVSPQNAKLILEAMNQQNRINDNITKNEQFDRKIKVAEDTLAETKAQNIAKNKIQEEDKKHKYTKLAIDESKPYQEAADTAEKTKRLISQGRKILKHGKPTLGFFAKIAEDLKLPGLTGNTDTELLSKIYSSLALQFGQALPPGTRGNVYIEQAYQKVVPQLGNTKEGALAIFDIMDLAADLVESQNEARKRILKEDKGEWNEQTADKIREQAKAEQERLINNTDKKLNHYKVKNAESSGHKFNKGAIDASNMPVGFLVETKDGRRLRLVDPKTNKWEEA